MTSEIERLQSVGKALLDLEEPDQEAMKTTSDQLRALAAAYRAGVESGSARNQSPSSEGNGPVLYMSHPSDPANCGEHCDAANQNCEERTQSFYDQGKIFMAINQSLKCSLQYAACIYGCAMRADAGSDGIAPGGGGRGGGTHGVGFASRAGSTGGGGGGGGTVASPPSGGTDDQDEPLDTTQATQGNDPVT